MGSVSLPSRATFPCSGRLRKQIVASRQRTVPADCYARIAAPQGASVMPAVTLGVQSQDAGFGMLWPRLTHGIVSTARPGDRDLAAACASTVSRIGGAIGSAANGLATNGAGLAGGAAAAHSYQASVWLFGTCVPLLLIGCAATRRI